MGNRAARIYLDTQDFNNLSKGDSEYEEIRSLLMNHVNDGKIEVGYSFPIIFELFRRYDHKHKPQRIKIARFLKELCGQKAFPHFVDFSDGAAFPNGGMWMPKSVMNVFSPSTLSTKLWEGVKNGVSKEKSLPRDVRRKLGSRSGFREIVNQLPRRDFSKEDFPNLPISEEIITGGYLQGFISGSVSAVTLSRKLTQWLSDPEAFIEFWYEYSGKENPLEPLVSNAYDKLSDAFEKMKAAKEGADFSFRNAKKAYSNLRRAIDSSDLPPEIISHIKIPASPKRPTIPRSQLDLESRVGKGRAGQFDFYMDALLHGTLKPMPSDLVDLLHLVYLPDVDLMRCDRRMFNLMKTCPSIQSHKLIGSLRELPEAIDRFHADRISSR